ncbi:site-specific integrase [Poseidonibacter ostreae]|uniref:Tyrosine-type recombinase/integrase n=1 Tax=Poseidonibacter ostreae TaxID=2654171 RepID=A0A6L4WWC4_9BACT|nr:site-specific integrase [Poseidonibacter ostreae]KAB7891352.1 tyrosine-type recombinase/integrase [Poseidonibacter ostreae]
MPKKQSKKAEYLGIKDIQTANIKIKNFPFESDFEKRRNILMFRLLCFTGVESGELLKLKASSFFIEDDILKLKIEKTSVRKERILCLSDNIFKECIKQYDEIRNENNPFYFHAIDNYKQAITLSVLQKIVSDLLSFANVNTIEKTPRMLRKSFAINLNNEKNPITNLTMPESVIQEILGVQNRTNLRKMLKLDTVDSDTLASQFNKIKVD